VPLHGLVEGHLLERGARIGVGCDQCIRVRVNKHAHRQRSGTQHDLRRRFVLTVKHMDSALTSFAVHPRQRYVQLRSLLVELFDQFGDVGADRARIDVVVVRQILDREVGKKEPKSAQLIFVNRHGTQRIVAKL